MTYCRTLSRITIFAIAVVLLASCESAGTTTTTTAAAGTTAPSSPSEFSVGNYGLLPDPLPGSDNANGSGCNPAGGDLSDGIWFGYVVDVTTDTLTFDLACFWTGQAAVDAAAKDGQQVSNDSYIRNDDPTTRTVQRDPAGTAYWVDPAMAGVESVAMSDWPVDTGLQECPSDHCAAWVYINGGVVTELAEQFLP
jgi:hypothetical protein